MAKPSRIEQIKAFLESSPKDAFLNYALAIEYVGSAQDAAAKAIFIELIHEQPDYHASYYHLAKLYERQGDFDEAEKTYRMGIDKCKELNEAHALRELQAALDELIYD